jgi:hypothetical protein
VVFFLHDLFQKVFRQYNDRTIRRADVLQDLNRELITILLMGYFVMLKIAYSLKEFLRSFSMK